MMNIKGEGRTKVTGSNSQSSVVVVANIQDSY